MVDEETCGYPEPSQAEMDAYDAEVELAQREKTARCKAQANCADSFGSRWTFFIRPEDRQGKVIGRCLCDDSRILGDVLDVTIVTGE